MYLPGATDIKVHRYCHDFSKSLLPCNNMACLVALMPQGKPVSTVRHELSSDQAQHNERIGHWASTDTESLRSSVLQTWLLLSS